MRRSLSALTLAVFLAAGSAFAQQASPLSRHDRNFALHAMEGGMMEVELGRMAQDHAGNDQVKQFGQRMVDDHTKNNDQLIAIAQQHGLNPPTRLSSADRREMDRLAKMQGQAFDNAYMAMMVDDHKKDIKAYRKEAHQGGPDLKAYAQDSLPVLQQHLQLAEDIARPQGAQVQERAR